MTLEPSADPAIDVRSLSHSYKSGTFAVDRCSFEVPSGAIHGFVGPNGAGKTTTLKVLATLLKPQSGTARVYGLDVRGDYKRIRTRIGFMPDVFNSYKRMTVHEYLDFFAAAYGMSLSQRDQTIKDVLALTDMAGRADTLLSGLSRGMTQRISLARVLVHDPDLLLLDEPASGLDPRARIELMEILKTLARLGKTIFISSHILSELADLCDSCTILDRGRTRFSGSMAELLAEAAGGDRRRYELVLAEICEPAQQAVRQLEGVEEVTLDRDSPGTMLVDADPAQVSPNAIVGAAIAAGGQLVRFATRERHLNQAFMELTDPGVGA